MSNLHPFKYKHAWLFSHGYSATHDTHMLQSMLYPFSDKHVWLVRHGMSSASTMVSHSINNCFSAISELHLFMLKHVCLLQPWFKRMAAQPFVNYLFMLKHVWLLHPWFVSLKCMFQKMALQPNLDSTFSCQTETCLALQRCFLIKHMVQRMALQPFLVYIY